MTVQELRLWLAEIPEEYDTSEMVWRNIEPNPEDKATWIITDDAIVGSGIDMNTGDMYFCAMETASIINVASNHGKEPDTKTE